MKKTILTGIKHLTGSLLLASVAVNVQAGSPVTGSTSLGNAAPDFNATTITGEAFNLSDYKGKKPVYLKFWATWCSYCKAEMPHLNSIKQNYGDDIQIVTINVGMNDSIKNINHFFQNQGYQLPTIFDQKGELTSRYGVVGTPHHILIDREGKIAYRTFLATDQLDQQIKDWADNKVSFNGISSTKYQNDLVRVTPVKKPNTQSDKTTSLWHSAPAQQSLITGATL